MIVTTIIILTASGFVLLLAALLAFFGGVMDGDWQDDRIDRPRPPAKLDEQERQSHNVATLRKLAKAPGRVGDYAALQLRVIDAEARAEALASERDHWRALYLSANAAIGTLKKHRRVKA